MGNTHEMRREEKAKFSYTTQTFCALQMRSHAHSFPRFNARRQIVHMVENLYEKSGGKIKIFCSLQ